jgi:hypothetical protein
VLELTSVNIGRAKLVDGSVALRRIAPDGVSAAMNQCLAVARGLGALLHGWSLAKRFLVTKRS